MKPIVPVKPSPKRLQPVSVKFTDETRKRIDRVVKATGQSRNAAINYLINDALDRWEAAQSGSPTPKR